MKWFYLSIDLCTVIIPFLFSFHPAIQFYKYYKAFIPANVLITFVFIIWDVLFTQMGVWGFNPDYVSGIYFFNLPIEEILFFICIPYACVFTYYCLTIFFNPRRRQRNTNVFTLILSLILLLSGFFFYNKLYTSITFISTAIILLIIQFAIKVKWLSKLFSIYPVLLIPFFIVNGLLTGYGLQQPVVWYNNSENLGLRLFTIPVEDIFYGFELILLNVFFFELFKSKDGIKRRVLTG